MKTDKITVCLTELARAGNDLAVEGLKELAALEADNAAMHFEDDDKAAELLGKGL